jgi:corrinoid protein of di/trimethylamine methyltransferase
MAETRELYDAILNGDAKSAIRLTRKALDEGCDPLGLVTGSMVPAMDEVGRRFASQEFYVPDLLLAGRAMKGALELVRPLLSAGAAHPSGKVVIGTVKGDLHDIGKNLVASMLEGGGFEIFDLGVDVPAAQFIAAVRKTNAGVVALSALLTTTLPAMKTVVEAFQQAGIRDQVKIMIGGAPATRQYAAEIGADAYCKDAVSAVETARTLVGKG